MNKQEQAPPASGGGEPTVFQSRVVRRTWHEGEWWFAIVDVVAALTDSVQPEGYLKDLRKRDAGLAQGWGQIASPLRLTTPGGVQLLNCANVIERAQASRQRQGAVMPQKSTRHSGRTHAVGEIRNLLPAVASTSRFRVPSPASRRGPRNGDVRLFRGTAP
jgi:hypothetical protein